MSCIAAVHALYERRKGKERKEAAVALEKVECRKRFFVE